MTGREKILLALICIAALYAAADTLLTRVPAFMNTASGRNDLQEARKAIQETGTSLAAHPVGPQLLHVLEQAGSPAADSAFAPLRAAAPSEAENAASNARGPESLSYSGYINVGGRALAVINGMEYAAGDTVPATGDIVRSVDAGQVVLYSPSRKTEWKLPYSGDDF